jgi:two-component system sensor histidine kinase ChvG
MMARAGWLMALPRWLYRIRTRLLLVNVVIVCVPVVGLGFARFYEREMLAAVETDMIHQAEVLRQLLRADVEAGTLAAHAAALPDIAAKTQTRIRLVDAGGHVVADSHADGPPEGVERAPMLAGPRLSGAPPQGGRRAAETAVGARPEIRRALAGQYGATTRVWRWPRYLSGAVEGERVYLFSALPLRRADGTVAGAVYMTRSTLPVLASMYRLRRALIKILVIVLVITAVLSLFLAATIARPLGNLIRTANRIAAGSRGESLRLERRDEIGDLARAIDEMARRLDRRAEETAALAADISHEFKSPLTSLRGAAELLLDGAAADAGARGRFLRNMLADTQRLDRVVTRLLELSRLEADRAPPVEIDLGDLVTEAIEAASGRGAVSWQAPSAPVRVLGRRAALLAAIRNLIENAQAHAAPGTTPAVTVAAQSSVVRLAVHNQGPPIPPEIANRIWDRFFTTRAENGGTGLGLPIVAAVATAHGGQVSFDSHATRGTTFVLALPAR